MADAPMKILFLTNIPSPYRVDFFEQVGQECNLTVLYETEIAKDRNANWLKKDKKHSYREVYLKPMIQKKDTGFCPEVKKYLDPKQYDIIVVGVYSTLTGMYAIRYMKKHKISYWISCDGGMRKDDTGLKYRLKSYFLTGATGYLSSGRITDEYLCYYGARQNRIHRYPFSSVWEKEVAKVPLTDCERKRVKEQLGIAEEKVILAIGQFIPRKGFDLLLEAAGSISKEYGIYIIGNEPNEQYMKLIEKNQLKHVQFLPFQPYEILEKYYQAADVFVLPTREDIWGLVINEALANALPVITTDKCVAGLEMVEDGKTGRIVTIENIEELAKAIREQLEILPEEKNIQRQYCLEQARNYTIERMAEAHIRIWKEEMMRK